MSFLQVGLGLVLLVVAGDMLVRGAVGLSLKLGLSTLIVSLTVVAFGTSAPELLTALQAVLAGAPDIAIGNVVGSNTANILLVLGLPALITPIPGGSDGTGRNYWLMLGGTALFIVLCLGGILRWYHGVIMLGALALILFDAYRCARNEKCDRASGAEPAELQDADPTAPMWKLLGALALGLVGLPIGAWLLVEGARTIALSFGVSEAAIGLTLVALGTSLPELFTVIMAAVRRHTDVALGNVIGSNLFNLLAIMGIASTVTPVPVSHAFLTIHFPVMAVSSLMLAPFILRDRPIGRVAGAVFMTGYVLYAAFALAI